MAKCDQGYLCEVCGKEVDGLTESALYLQYVVGWIDPETLHTRRECHLQCLPTLAQYIDDERFTANIEVPAEFDRMHLDAEFVRERSALITRGYQRLWELKNKRRGLTVAEYPLAETIERWR